MTPIPPEPLEVGALAIGAALADDDTAVRHLLHSLPPQHAAVVCEGAVLAMAQLLREFLPPEAIAEAITTAQNLAREAATEGTGR